MSNLIFGGLSLLLWRSLNRIIHPRRYWAIHLNICLAKHFICPMFLFCVFCIEFFFFIFDVTHFHGEQRNTLRFNFFFVVDSFWYRMYLTRYWIVCIFILKKSVSPSLQTILLNQGKINYGEETLRPVPEPKDLLAPRSQWFMASPCYISLRRLIREW